MTSPSYVKGITTHQYPLRIFPPKGLGIITDTLARRPHKDELIPVAGSLFSTVC